MRGSRVGRKGGEDGGEGRKGGEDGGETSSNS